MICHYLNRCIIIQATLYSYLCLLKSFLKKPEQVKSIILIQFSFFCLYCYNFTASRVHQSISVPLLAVNASVCFLSVSLPCRSDDSARTCRPPLTRNPPALYSWFS